ncbi:hypothetical protein D3C71_1916190 [compost metagenome]
MGQGAPVVILRLTAKLQADSPVTGRHQLAQAAARSFGQGFGTAPLTPEFGTVQTDQAHTATILQAQGVAIDHPLDLDARQFAGRRTERLNGAQVKHGHKKGAHQGRLFQ